jgi:hypothetical protein
MSTAMVLPRMGRHPPVIGSEAVSLRRGPCERYRDATNARRAGRALAIPCGADMHIYCDESGGLDPASPRFLTTVVAIEPREAGHLINRLRKRTGLIGEAHGWALDTRQRELFLRFLHDRDGVAAVTVVLQPGSLLQGATSGPAREAVVRTHMIAEGIISVCTAARLPRSSTVGITIDGGRYKRAELERERGKLVELLAEAEPSLRFSAQYDDSQKLHGLQVADIIGNTVYRSLKGTTATEEESWLSALAQRGLLRTCEAVLPALRPRWVTAI